MRRLRIAVVGGGAAGLAAAWHLHERHDVALFERRRRVGGHVHTVQVDEGPDAGTPVDTGFIVFNARNYPLFSRLLGELDVESRSSDMSFGYHREDSGLQYCGTSWNGLFAQRGNLLRPSFWRLLRGIVRFCRGARMTLDAIDAGHRGALGAVPLTGTSLGEFLDRCGCGHEAATDYVVPLAAAIWSGSRSDIRGFPAATLLRFFDNHGLLSLRDRPRWRTIVGGSHAWVRRLLARFGGTVHAGAAVVGIRRDLHGVRLWLETGARMDFDRVVVASHADQALNMLLDPSHDERRLLGAWTYGDSLAVLHTHEGLMPPLRRAWASWNYRRLRDSGEDDPVVVTYDMNRLQGLRTTRRYLVSLNPPPQLPATDVLKAIRYRHPIYTERAVATQEPLQELGSESDTYYCGSYLGHGFHEDAIRSGFGAADRLERDLLEKRGGRESAA